MNTMFEVEKRLLSESELIYALSGRQEFSLKAVRDEMCFDEVIETLTPSRRAVALAAVELFRRTREKKPVQVYSSRDLFSLMCPVIGVLQVEEAWAVFLNHGNRIIKKVRVSVGGLTGTMVDIRVVAAEALKCGATSVMLAHNHPSGSTHPSTEDDRLTRRLAEGLKLIDIRLLDHLIICEESYYSYSDESKIIY